MRQMSAADTWFGQRRRVGVSGVAATDTAARRCRRRVKLDLDLATFRDQTDPRLGSRASGHARHVNIKLSTISFRTWQT
jgi:hypothetical protein